MSINSNYLGKKKKTVGKFEKTSVMTMPYFSRVNLLPCGNSHLKKLEYSCSTVLFISAVQASESVVCTHISPPSHPPRPRSPQSSEPSFLHYMASSHWLHGREHLSVPASQFIPPFTICSLHSCVSSCPADRFIRTIQIPYTCIHIQDFSFLFLTDFTPYVGIIYVSAMTQCHSLYDCACRCTTSSLPFDLSVDV